MKTILKITALVFAVTFTAAVAASFSGLTLPVALNPTTLFGALVASLTLLTVVRDYTRVARPAWRYAPVAQTTLATAGKSAHPLAA